MSTKNKAQEVTDKVKAKAGEITGNKVQQAHGKVAQAQANLKQAAEKVKDAFTSSPRP
jgi:uncharacterized protein YjbJ (UPF0337 family)